MWPVISSSADHSSTFAECSETSAECSKAPCVPAKIPSHAQSIPNQPINPIISGWNLELSWRSLMTLSYWVRLLMLRWHLPLIAVSRAAAQRLGVMRKSCQVFRDRSLLMNSSRRFILPVCEYCLRCGAQLPIKLLYRVVRSLVL